MRLDQFLVQANICSRREAKELVKKGRVCVDGDIVTNSAIHIDETKSQVTLDGNEISYEKFRYYMLNKPDGVVSAVRDGLSETVIGLLKDENTNGLFPVGRLDKDTEGLLLITNDGQLSHRLLSPKKHVDKTYLVMADRELSDDEMEHMEEGLDIGDDRPTMPAKIEIYNDGKDSGIEYKAQYLLTIHEGRFHQVKRMFEAVNARVIRLKRLSMGSLKLDENLLPGEYRKLDSKEIENLKKLF